MFSTLITDRDAVKPYRPRHDLSPNVVYLEAPRIVKESKTFEEMVPEWCRDFIDLFDKDNFDELPEPKMWDHVIELTPNTSANLDCKVYPLNQNEQAELNKFLDENLSSGCI